MGLMARKVNKQKKFYFASALPTALCLKRVNMFQSCYLLPPKNIKLHFSYLQATELNKRISNKKEIFLCVRKIFTFLPIILCVALTHTVQQQQQQNFADTK